MLTSKQSVEAIKRLETGSLSELDNRDFPTPLFADWLPQAAKDVISQNVELMYPMKQNKTRLVWDMWPQLVNEFMQVHPWFVAPAMKPVWDKIVKKHPNKVSELTRYLLRIPNDFVGATRLIYKHHDEVKSCERMIAKAKKLADAMEEYQCHYFGHMLFERHNELFDELGAMIASCSEKLKEFQKDRTPQSYSSPDNPITRELRTESTMPVFFARKLSIFFREHFKKPMNDTVADMVNLIFSTTYTENNIVKFVKTTSLKVTTEGEE